MKAYVKQIWNVSAKHGRHFCFAITKNFVLTRPLSYAKGSYNAYNYGGYPILWDLLNEWVVEGETFDPHDII